MEFNAFFFLNSFLFGVGLAMDAFSVSIVNGLTEPHMPRGRVCFIAGSYGLFQVGMPLLSWFCVRRVAAVFTAIQPFIPWIALLLLLFIGGRMLLQGLRGEAPDASAAARLGLGTLLLQDLATSIDALSVGFTIADLHWQAAVTEACIIGVTTFLICCCGLAIGKRFGLKFARRAPVLGGILLIAIGLEILLSHLL